MKKYTIAFGILLSLVLTTCYASNDAHTFVQNRISTHETFNGIPVRVVNPFSVVLKFGDTFAGGVYDTNAKQIFIAESGNKFELTHILYHESCHYIWAKAKGELKNAYRRAYEIHNVSVSRYGRTDLKENFAEMCARINGSAYKNYTLPKGYLETSEQFDLANIILEQWERNGIVK